MMKSKLSSKNLVKSGLRLLPLVFFLAACSSSLTPSFLKKDAARAIQEICKKEYKIEVSATLSGRTLWVYLPLENIVSRSDKPQKSLEKFLLEDKKNALDSETLKVNYWVQPIAEKERIQDTILDKSVAEKNSYVLQVIHRVLMSLDKTEKDPPQFFCIITADIKNGVEIKQTSYVPDLKKLAFGLVSRTEYMHRVIQDPSASARIIGDKTGVHLNYQDIMLEDFIADQIQSRIRLKFQTPEVESSADIDKEVLKIIAYTLDAYQFKDFSLVEITNHASGKKTIFNQTSILADLKE